MEKMAKLRLPDEVYNWIKDFLTATRIAQNTAVRFLSKPIFHQNMIFVAETNVNIKPSTSNRRLLSSNMCLVNE